MALFPDEVAHALSSFKANTLCPLSFRKLRPYFAKCHWYFVFHL